MPTRQRKRKKKKSARFGLTQKSYLQRSCLNRVIKTLWGGVRGSGNQGALNANRKLSGGGGGRKHQGIYEQVTDVTRLPPSPL
jgi:hypothetical protein